MYAERAHEPVLADSTLKLLLHGSQMAIAISFCSLDRLLHWLRLLLPFMYPLKLDLFHELDDIILDLHISWLRA